MDNVFTRSFSASKTKAAENVSSFHRPNIVTGGRIDDVLRHYVKPSDQVVVQGQRSANGHAVPSSGALDANLMKTISDRRDIKNILEMNPNAQLAIDICVNGTLSPNNTLDNQLQYKSSYDKLGALKSPLLQRIREVMNEFVELEDILPTILRDAKYDVGSYALLVVPTGQIKDMIMAERIHEQQTTSSKVVKFESVISDLSNATYKKGGFRNSHYMDASKLELKLEDFGMPKNDKFEGGDITVHANMEVLRFNKLREDAVSKLDIDGCVDDLDGYSSYDFNADNPTSLKQEDLSAAVIAGSLQRARAYSFDDVITLEPKTDFESADVPVHMHIPHESIFVLHKPGSPEDHVGYYIALDMSGNAISVDGELGMYQPTYSGVYGNDASNSAMAGQANFAGGNLELGYSGYADNSIMGRRLSDKTALFTKVMEDRLLKKIQSGYFKNTDISLAEHRDLMQLMFTRYMSNKQTQLIFVPKSLMTYVAFEYDENGNGISLIIKHKNIGVLNSILTLANTLAAINNTIDYKEVRVKFDDDELDFSKTTDMIVGNLARSTSLNGSRLLNTDVNRQVDYLGIKGYQLAFEDHPQFPGTSVEINNLDRERTVPDADIIEKNEALLIQSLGSTPEVVDMARNVEFASSYFQSNLQAARRAIADQKILTKFLNKFIHIYILNAPVVLKWLITEVDKSRKDNPELKGVKTTQIVKEFVKSITVHLPKPDMVKVELLDKAITEQEKLVDHILKYTIGEEALVGEDVGENLEATLEAVRRKIKAVIMRDFLASNNMFNEGIINAIYNNDEEELDAAMSRLESQQEFTLNFLKKHEIITSTVIQKVNEEVIKVKEAKELGEGGGSAGSDFGNDTSTEGQDDPNADTGSDPVDGAEPNSDPDAGGEPDPNADPFA